MRILITGGGTREPIDGVRFITNFSTGKTAASLADHFAGRGDSVTYVCAQGAARPVESCRTRSYVTFKDLDETLRDALRSERFDAVIHLAAVSDYSVASIEAEGKTFVPGDRGKLPSGTELTLKLSPNHKIVDRIKGYASGYAPGRKPLLIAFKLTHSATEEERQAAVEKLAESGEVDAIVHNDLGERNAGLLRFTLYRGSEPLARFDSISALAQGLAQLIHQQAGVFS